MKKLLFIFFLLCFATAHAQDDSTGIKVSLLTCAPGEELYSTFGHTAIRVLDSVQQTDYVYNYGLFDFSEPNFYIKFVRGQLNYMLGVQTFEEFLYEYQLTGRSVWEQDILFTPQQKLNVIQFLNNNLKEENRYYKYDFIYDNCATRARDVLLNQLPGYHLQKPYIEEGTTARNLFHYYLDNGKNQAWSKLGIDILLGSGIDTAMNNFSGMFLPEFLMNAFNGKVYKGKPIVQAKKTLVIGNVIKESNYYVPFITMLAFSVILFLIYFFKRKNSFLVNILDSVLLFITGALGCLLLFMWFFTDHESCNNNYNLLWAVPLNLIVALMPNKRKSGLRAYWLVLACITSLLLLGWYFLPQHLNFALIPIVLLMLYRYIDLYFGAKR